MGKVIDDLKKKIKGTKYRDLFIRLENIDRYIEKLGGCIKNEDVTPIYRVYIERLSLRRHIKYK